MNDKTNARIIEIELQFVCEILSGNAERYFELIAPIERRVYFTAYEILGSPADAEEVAQEAILKGFRNLASFRGESKFVTWLMRITINEARLRLRNSREVSLESLQRESSEGDYTPIQLADWREVPEKALEQKELANHLSTAIESLPLPYREVLILRDIDGLTIAETSKVLEISLSNVKIRLLRARFMLRDYFVSNRLI